MITMEVINQEYGPIVELHLPIVHFKVHFWGVLSLSSNVGVESRYTKWRGCSVAHLLMAAVTLQPLLAPYCRGLRHEGHEDLQCGLC